MIWYILDQKENINLKGIAKKAKEKVTKNKIFLVIFMKFGIRKRVNKHNLLTPQEL